MKVKILVPLMVLSPATLVGLVSDLRTMKGAADSDLEAADGTVIDNYILWVS